MSHIARFFENTLDQRLSEKPEKIQVILGPRQVGKTTGVLHLLSTRYKKTNYEYFECEDGIKESNWLHQKIQDSLITKSKIIVFDEIQKIDNWADQIKLIWDRNRRSKTPFHLVLLGSSSIEISQGLGDSLAGRFELIPAYHWNFNETHKISQMDFNDYLRYGGYPGSYPLLKDKKRFNKYVQDSLFETVVMKDILRFVQIKKPALFRQTFILASQYPAQEVSYNKLLGQLQDAGNVDQVKNYLDHFAQAFLIRLIFKWSETQGSRTSSPKLIPTANVFTQLFSTTELTQEQLGRVFESTVGNRLCENFDQVYYWREGKFEVDFIVVHNKQIYAIEVKSKNRKSQGMTEFKKRYPKALSLYIHTENYLEFEKNPLHFVEEYSL